MTATTPVELVDAATADALRPELAAILTDCVDGGASVSFLAPLDPAVADEFWGVVVRQIASGQCLLLVARGADRRIAGTVQLGLDTPMNQPHRADVRKLLVHSRARRRGVGEALMTRIETVALAAGRSLLTLDTVTGSDAERLYRRLGWNHAGIIPRYALDATGEARATSIYWKEPAAAGPARPSSSTTW